MQKMKIFTLLLLVVALLETASTHRTLPELSSFGEFLEEHLRSSGKNDDKPKVTETVLHSEMGFGVSDAETDLAKYMQERERKEERAEELKIKRGKTQESKADAQQRQEDRRAQNKKMLADRKEKLAVIEHVLEIRKRKDREQIKKEKGMKPEERLKSQTQRREEQLAEIRRLLKMTPEERLVAEEDRLIEERTIEHLKMAEMSPVEYFRYKQEQRDVEFALEQEKIPIMQRNLSLPQKIELIKESMEEQKIPYDLLDIILLEEKEKKANQQNAAKEGQAPSK